MQTTLTIIIITFFSTFLFGQNVMAQYSSRASSAYSLPIRSPNLPIPRNAVTLPSSSMSIDFVKPGISLFKWDQPWPGSGNALAAFQEFHLANDPNPGMGSLFSDPNWWTENFTPFNGFSGTNYTYYNAILNWAVAHWQSVFFPSNCSVNIASSYFKANPVIFHTSIKEKPYLIYEFFELVTQWDTTPFIWWNFIINCCNHFLRRKYSGQK